jgi:hypothetical protein
LRKHFFSFLNKNEGIDEIDNEELDENTYELVITDKTGIYAE